MLDYNCYLLTDRRSILRVQQMKRVVKKPDIRKREIISAAKELIETQGYSQTSVESIIKHAGIAKGTFYHYFKTKQDILDAIVEQIAEELEDHFNSIIEMSRLTAIQKLKLMLRGQEKKKIASKPVMAILHKLENRELQEKLNIKSVTIIAPLIAKVLTEGKMQGMFRHSPSVESVQIILAGSEFILSSGLFELSAPKKRAFLKSVQHLLETLVGAKSGDFAFLSK